MKLVLVSGSKQGLEFNLEEGSNLVGRWDPDKTSFPEIDLEEIDEDAKVSRKHALIRRSGEAVSIEDLGSLNGTYLNGSRKLEPRLKYELRPGDEIIIGRMMFRLQA